MEFVGDKFGDSLDPIDGIGGITRINEEEVTGPFLQLEGKSRATIYICHFFL